MRHLRSFCLTLAFGCFVAMLFSYIPRGSTVLSDVVIDRTDNLRLRKFNSSKEVEKDGIHLEISGPYPALPIPKQGLDKISLGLGLEITNNTSTTIQAGWENLIPELVGPDGQPLQLQTATSERSGTPISCRLIQPPKPGYRQTVGFLPGKLSWMNNKLQLQVAAGFGDVRYFDDLKPGTYQLRFIYDSSGGTVSCYDSDIRQVRKVEGLGAGRAATPFVGIHLVQPVAIDSNTVEIDGIWFETVVPKHVIPIPHRSTDAATPVPVGIRITNKGSSPRFFSRFDILAPGLIGLDGKPLNLESSRAGSAAGQCPLVQPGKSVTFFWDAKLSWQNNELQLEGFDSFNSFLQFKALKPGTYQIRMNYLPHVRTALSLCGKDTQTSSSKPLRGLPLNSGVNSFVEISLVQR